MSLLKKFRENAADISSSIDRFLATRAEKRLEEAKSLLATVPEGKALLQLAQQLDCPIVTKRILGIKGRYTKFSGGHIISISPHMTVQRLTSTLAHELRHMWQYHHTPELYNAPLSTSSLLAVVRVLEGDAFAFEKNAMAKINGKNGGSYEAAFRSFQSSLNASGYDCLALSGSRPTKNVQLKEVFNDHAFNHAPDLRKILVPGLDTQATPYIAAESGKALLSNLLKTAEKQKIKRILVASAIS